MRAFDQATADGAISLQRADRGAGAEAPHQAPPRPCAPRRFAQRHPQRSADGKDHLLVRRLRTLTFGLLTPFYFIRAGSYVSVSALAAAIGVLALLLGSKMLTKFVGVYPITRLFRTPFKEAMYTTSLMSTGLTFGSISALFGLTHGIVDQRQHSYLIAAVIGSAIVPRLIANAFFLPKHLRPAEIAPNEASGTAPAAVSRFVQPPDPGRVVRD